MPDDKTPMNDVRWLPVRNVSLTDTIPAHGLVAIVGRDEDGTLQVDVPTDDSQLRLLVNGVTDIPPSDDDDEGGFGQAFRDFPADALYDENDGTPVAGDEWGVQGGGYVLRSGLKGYKIVGQPDNGIVTIDALTIGTQLARVGAWPYLWTAPSAGVLAWEEGGPVAPLTWAGSPVTGQPVFTIHGSPTWVSNVPGYYCFDSTNTGYMQGMPSPVWTAGGAFPTGTPVWPGTPNAFGYYTGYLMRLYVGDTGEKDQVFPGESFAPPATYADSTPCFLTTPSTPTNTATTLPEVLYPTQRYVVHVTDQKFDGVPVFVVAGATQPSLVRVTFTYPWITDVADPWGGAYKPGVGGYYLGYLQIPDGPSAVVGDQDAPCVFEPKSDDSGQGGQAHALVVVYDKNGYGLAETTYEARLVTCANAPAPTYDTTTGLPIYVVDGPPLLEPVGGMPNGELGTSVSGGYIDPFVLARAYWFNGTTVLWGLKPHVTVGRSALGTFGNHDALGNMRPVRLVNDYAAAAPLLIHDASDSSPPADFNSAWGFRLPYAKAITLAVGESAEFAYVNNGVQSGWYLQAPPVVHLLAAGTGITLTPVGNTTTISASISAGALTGTVLASNVVTSSLTTVGTLIGGATGAGFTINLGTSTIVGALAVTNGGTGGTTTATAQAGIGLSSAATANVALSGSGAPSGAQGIAGSVYFDVGDPSNPMFYFKA